MSARPAIFLCFFWRPARTAALQCHAKLFIRHSAGQTTLFHRVIYDICETNNERKEKTLNEFIFLLFSGEDSQTTGFSVLSSSSRKSLFL
jgi:hypothetical protein